MTVKSLSNLRAMLNQQSNDLADPAYLAGTNGRAGGQDQDAISAHLRYWQPRLGIRKARSIWLGLMAPRTEAPACEKAFTVTGVQSCVARHSGSSPLVVVH